MSDAILFSFFFFVTIEFKTDGIMAIKKKWWNTLNMRRLEKKKMIEENVKKYVAD